MTDPVEGFPAHPPRDRVGAVRRRCGPAITIMWVAALLAGCGQLQQVTQSGTVGASGQVGAVLLRDVYVERPPSNIYPGGSNATLRLTLINQASQPDALTSATTDVAARVEILADTGCDGTTETLPRLDLPARVDLTSSPNAPGPTHAQYFLRLIDLKIGILQGGSVSITFTFSRAGTVTLPAPVGGITTHPAGTATPTPCASPSRG
jgi:copper(I)-binding protein